jgi:hypothetical protein
MFICVKSLYKNKFGVNESLVYNATHMHTHWVIEIITAEWCGKSNKPPSSPKFFLSIKHLLQNGYPSF